MVSFQSSEHHTITRIMARLQGVSAFASFEFLQQYHVRFEEQS